MKRHKSTVVAALYLYTYVLFRSIKAQTYLLNELLYKSLKNVQARLGENILQKYLQTFTL